MKPNAGVSAVSLNTRGLYMHQEVAASGNGLWVAAFQFANLAARNRSASACSSTVDGINDAVSTEFNCLTSPSLSRPLSIAWPRLYDVLCCRTHQQSPGAEVSYIIAEHETRITYTHSHTHKHSNVVLLLFLS